LTSLSTSNNDQLVFSSAIKNQNSLSSNISAPNLIAHTNSSIIVKTNKLDPREKDKINNEINNTYIENKSKNSDDSKPENILQSNLYFIPFLILI